MSNKRLIKLLQNQGGADARRRFLGLLQSNNTPRSFGNDPDWNKF